MNGIVNLNKPPGITSFKAVSLVKRLFCAKKAGHTGTLDPSASGVLPICIGRATRIGQFLLNSNKVYCGRMKLGIRTDTQDAEGKIIQESKSFHVTESQLREIFSRYVGEIEQIPPMFSAKKIGGEKLYKLARQGIELEREPKRVKIAFFSFLGLEGDEVLFRTETSSGTYVRTLCDSIGEDLGCGAHLKHLIREKVGNIDIKDAFTLEQLQDMKGAGRLDEILSSMSDALSFYPLVRVDSKTEAGISKGMMLHKRGILEFEGRFHAEGLVRAIGEGGGLIAILESLVGAEEFERMGRDVPVMKPKKVFSVLTDHGRKN